MRAAFVMAQKAFSMIASGVLLRTDAEISCTAMGSLKMHPVTARAFAGFANDSHGACLASGLRRSCSHCSSCSAISARATNREVTSAFSTRRGSRFPAHSFAVSVNILAVRDSTLFIVISNIASDKIRLGFSGFDERATDYSSLSEGVVG